MKIISSEFVRQRSIVQIAKALFLSILATSLLLSFTLTAATASDTITDIENQIVQDVKQGSILGVVWIDSNRNGQQDPQEPTIVGQTIFVTPNIESDFAQVLVLSTNEQGEFNATGLSLGSYRIWASSQDETSARVVSVTTDRAVMVVGVPLVGFTLFVPQVAR